MEEYITRAEFEAYKKQMEQRTEEMRALRVDVHNVDVEAIKQELHTVSDTWLETLQEHYTEHQTVLKGHEKYFEAHGKRLGKIESDVSDIKGMLQKLLDQRSE